MEVQFGQYALPVILSVLLSIIFKMAGGSIGDRFKSLIAIVCGIALGIVGLFYTGEEPRTTAMWVDYIIYGFMSGAAAVGLYEATRAVAKPRS